MDKALKINSKRIERKLITFIRNATRDAGFRRAVIGLSGGLDSSIVLYLCSRALGAKNVLGLIMPYKTSSKTSVQFAQRLARKYKVKTRAVSITPQIDSYFKKVSRANRVRRGNKMARERMSILYDYSKVFNALVAGTGNKTEILLGYGTMHGDVACAFNPIAGLYKTQLRQFARDVGIPDEIIVQIPSAGLWPGQSDEGELGLTYYEVDRLLFAMVERKLSDKKLIARGFKKSFIKKVKALIAANQFKSSPPKLAKP